MSTLILVPLVCLAAWIIHDLLRYPETHDTETPGRTE